MENGIDKIKELVNIALTYDIDYIYILEDIQKLLNGQDIKIKIENYIK